MLKIAVFDTGFGGELFADRLEEALPVVKVIRVIDWRNALKVEQHPREARKIAEEALRPYIGTVDLIVIANYLISAVGLSYFRRKYPNQKFIGFTLRPHRISTKPTVILTTRATTRNFVYFSASHRLKAKTICLDRWPHLIDDGELTSDDFKKDLDSALSRVNFSPSQVMLACGQFTDLLPEFRKFFGHNTRIVDSFDDTMNEVYKILRIPGRPKTR